MDQTLLICFYNASAIQGLNPPINNELEVFLKCHVRQKAKVEATCMKLLSIFTLKNSYRVTVLWSTGILPDLGRYIINFFKC